MLLRCKDTTIFRICNNYGQNNLLEGDFTSSKNLTGGLSLCEAALYEASRRCLQNKNLKLFVVFVVVLCEEVVLLAGRIIQF